MEAGQQARRRFGERGRVKSGRTRGGGRGGRGPRADAWRGRFVARSPGRAASARSPGPGTGLGSGRLGETLRGLGAVARRGGAGPRSPRLGIPPGSRFLVLPGIPPCGVTRPRRGAPPDPGHGRGGVGVDRLAAEPFDGIHGHGGVHGRRRACGGGEQRAEHDRERPRQRGRKPTDTAHARRSGTGRSGAGYSGAGHMAAQRSGRRGPGTRRSGAPTADSHTVGLQTIGSDTADPPAPGAPASAESAVSSACARPTGRGPPVAARPSRPVGLRPVGLRRGEVIRSPQAVPRRTPCPSRSS